MKTKLHLHKIVFVFIALFFIHSVFAGKDLEKLKEKAQKENSAKSWNNLAEYCYNERKYPEILKEAAENALKLAQNEQNRLEEGRAYLYVSDLYYQEGKINEYLSTNQKALEIITSQNSFKLEEEALNNIATAYGEKGVIDSLIWYAQKAVEINLKHGGEKSQLGAEYQNIAYGYNVSKMADSSAYYSQKTIEALTEAKDTVRMLDAYIQAGAIYASMGQYQKTIDCYEGTLKIYDLIDNKQNRLYVYNNLAAIYNLLEEYDKAIEFSAKAIGDAINNNEKPTIGKLLCSHASQLTSAGKYQASIDTLQLAIPYIKESLPIYRYALNTMAINHYILNQQDSSNYYVSLIEELLEENKDLPDASYYFLKANMLAHQGKYKEASEDINILINILPKLFLGNMGSFAYKTIGDIYANGMGDFKNGYSYLSQALSMADSIHKKENQAVLNDYYAKYKTAEKEVEITRLQLEKEKDKQSKIIIISISILVIIILFIFFLYNRIQRLKKEKEAEQLARHIKEKETEFHLLKNEAELTQMRSYLNGLEAERSRLAKELHDNVANELLGIDMQLKKAVQIPDNISAQIEELHTNIRNVSHELMPPVFKYASIPEIVRDYVYKLNERKNIRFDITINDEYLLEELPEELSLEIYRIIQECAGNIVKHSSATTAWINLAFPDNKTVHLEIGDNGKGFDLQKKRTGIGLQIIKDRIQALNGEITIDAQEGRGTVINIHVPAHIEFEDIDGQND